MSDTTVVDLSSKNIVSLFPQDLPGVVEKELKTLRIFLQNGKYWRKTWKSVIASELKHVSQRKCTKDLLHAYFGISAN